jgi:LacI family transcriptional regulator
MNKSKKVTIHDIAKKLNITASTVSRSLNDNPRISDKTKKRVLKMAEDLNYKPNSIASALRNGRTQVIGLLVPLIDRAFFSSIIRGVEEVAHGYNYHVIVSQSYENKDNEIKAVKAFLNSRVDCVVASIGKSTSDYSHFKEVKDSGIPLILFDRTTPKLQTSQVVIDDYQGGYMATAHLIEQGCSKIVHIMSYRNLGIYKERYRGYLDALKDNGIEFDEKLVVTGNSQLEDGRQHAENLLKSKIEFDAIFSASDYCALGAMQVLKEHGIKIPDDVAIVGFSNEPFTSFTDPSISSINQYPIEMGNTVARLFFDNLNSENKNSVPKKTVIQPQLIVRQSSTKKILAGIE